MIDGLGSGVAAAGGDRHRLAEVLVGFVRLLVSAHADPALPLWRMQLILRELQAPSPDFAVVMDGHIRPLHDAVDGLVAVALGREKDDERTRLLAQSVIAECLQIGFGRSLILNRLGWDDLTPERIDRVARVIGTATLGMLGLPDPDARPDEEPR